MFAPFQKNMAQLNWYKRLTYILALPTLFMAITALATLLDALNHIMLLIIPFILSCFVVYYISSCIFLVKVISAKKTCKRKVKDLIKINGAIAGIISIVLTLQLTVTFIYPAQAKTRVLEMIAINPAIVPIGYSTESFLKMFMTIMAIVLFYMILLLVHILISFKLIKTNNQSFV